MQNITLEETQALLESKIKLERKRLKSYGTKASAFDFAHSLAPNVLGLTSKARWLEINALKSLIQDDKKFGRPKRQVRKVIAWLKERERELAIQKDAVQKLADKKESNRPWKSRALLTESSSSRTRKKKKSLSKKHHAR